MQEATSRDRSAYSGLTPTGLSYAVNAWSPFSLVKMDIEATETRLTLRKLYRLEPATIWTTSLTVPLIEGDVVFIKAAQMSYFDFGRSEAVTIPINCVGTAGPIGLRARLRDYWERLQATPTPAGWYLDPTGRHVYRYWNGSVWTENVSTGDGLRSTDPLK